MQCQPIARAATDLHLKTVSESRYCLVRKKKKNHQFFNRYHKCKYFIAAKIACYPLSQQQKYSHLVFFNNWLLFIKLLYKKS